MRVRIVLGLLLAAAATFVGWRWLGHPRQYGADELLRLALDHNAPDKQELAASQLTALACRESGCGDLNPLQPYLLRVLRESDNPGARAASIRGLATIFDYGCGPALLEALDDPSAQVRNAAAMAIQRLISRRFLFRANDPPQKRQAVAEEIRQEWGKYLRKREESVRRELEDEERSMAKNAKP